MLIDFLFETEVVEFLISDEFHIFRFCALRPVVSAGSTPCVELVTGETSNKTGLTRLEVCHLDHNLAV